MPEYTVLVHVSDIVEYTVEADSVDEARENYESGRMGRIDDTGEGHVEQVQLDGQLVWSIPEEEVPSHGGQ